MKLVYLYTCINWYRLELFKSLSKIMDLHVYILNGFNGGYESIDWEPQLNDLNITLLTEQESKTANLCRILDREEFDAIVVPSMNSVSTLKLTTELSRRYNKSGRIVLYFWEYWPMEIGTYGVNKLIKQFARSAFTRINNRYIDYFITPSANTFAFYKRLNIPSNKLVYCPNSSEVKSSENTASIREELNIGNDEKVILYFGRIEEYKGIFILIDAFKAAAQQSWHLLICGPGEEIITDKVAGFKNIHIVGAINPDDRSRYYEAADVFVLANTYKNKIEAWGLTVNEALSFGVPVIASNATGAAIDLIIQGVNGYIIDAKRANLELPYYLTRILTDESLGSSHSDSNWNDYMGKYTFDNMARAFYVAIEKGMLTRY